MPVSTASACGTVLHQELVHIEGKGTATSRHLILRNAERTVGARTKESKAPREALLFFDGYRCSALSLSTIQHQANAE